MSNANVDHFEVFCKSVIVRKRALVVNCANQDGFFIVYMKYMDKSNTKHIRKCILSNAD